MCARDCEHLLIPRLTAEHISTHLIDLVKDTANIMHGDDGEYAHELIASFAILILLAGLCHRVCLCMLACTPRLDQYVVQSPSIQTGRLL